MIPAWIIYVTLVSLLISAAALIAERAMSSRHVQRRHVWLLAMLTSLLLPLAMATVAFDVPSSASTSPEPVALRDFTSIDLAATRWLQDGAQASAFDLERIFTIGWLAASMTLLAFLAGHVVSFHWQKRAWHKQTIGRQVYYVTPNTGPAVCGFLRPQIVLPQWLSTLPNARQSLIFAHERSHIDARDPLLLLVSYLFICLMPWNIPLWWQFMRLRRAIEMDCDARVLRAGASHREYGEALITVAQRRSEMLSVALSMSHLQSLLERRIAIMSQSHRPAPRSFVVALSVLSLGLVTAAAQVSPPSQLSLDQLVKIDTSILDKYVGAYAYSEATVMHVARHSDHVGDHLQVRFTGQETPDDVYAQSKTTFFYTKPAVDAQIEFVGNGDSVEAAILRQNGAGTRMKRIEAASANAIESQVAQRVASQTPSPASETMLREFISDILRGQINSERLSPQLVGALRKDLPKLQAKLAPLGSPTSYQFIRVSSRGSDEYNVTHEHGSSRWGIVLDPNGVITGASVPL